MIEPYFAVWKKTRDAWSKEEPLGSLRSGWKNTSGFEKLAFSLFVTYGAVMLILAVAFAFNRALLPVYCIGYAVFLLLYAGMKRVFVARDRQIPAWKLNVHAPLIEQLRSEFKGVGLVNYEQVRIVKEEAVRLLARKEHRNETIVPPRNSACSSAILMICLLRNSEGPSPFALVPVVGDVLCSIRVTLTPPRFLHESPFVQKSWGRTHRLTPLATVRYYVAVDSHTE